MYPDRRKGVGFPDYLQYLLSREVHQIPGTQYCYSTGDSVFAGRMCEKATGTGLPQFLYETFLKRLVSSFRYGSIAQWDTPAAVPVCT